MNTKIELQDNAHALIKTKQGYDDIPVSTPKQTNIAILNVAKVSLAKTKLKLYLEAIRPTI